MPKEANQSKQWDFSVAQVKLHTPEGKFSGYFGNQRTDTGEILGVTSEQYGLVQNKELMTAAQAALESKGMQDFEQSVIVTGGGQRLYAEFSFKDRQLATSVGDVLGYKLILQNSFDRTLRASFALGFLRLACLNGMTTMEKEFSVTRKHSTKITVDFLGEAIDKAIEQAPNAIKVYDLLQKRAVSDEQGKNILEHFEEAKILSGTVREAVETLWLTPRRAEDKARNLYSLYNAVTEHITHKVAGERYEYASKTSNTVLFSLVNAARNEDKFNKLILPKPQNPKTVIVATGPVQDVEIVN